LSGELVLHPNHPAAKAGSSAPSNIEAEQMLLGCLLYDNESFKACQGLDPADLYEPFHSRLFSAIAERIEGGHFADPILIGKRFAEDKAYVELGGMEYLGNLMDRAPPSQMVPAYVSAIRDAALRRNLIRTAHDYATAARAAEAEGQGYELAAAAERDLADLARGSEPDDKNMIDARASAEATLAQFETEAELGKPKGLMTGLRCFDRRLRGLRPGHVIIVAGRPSMGKTALARQAAFGAASRNPGILFPFFAQEMDRRELDERNLSQLTYEDSDGIPYQNMTGDKLSPMDRRRLADLVWKVPKNLIIDDSAVLTVEHVRRRIWSLKRKGKVGAAFIDYLQIMQRPASGGRNDAAILGEMTSSLKRLAREAEIAIVLLSQINRGVESREDKRPQLSDLRESGSIEQDANSVLFTFRESYYLERAEPKESSTEHAKWEEQVELLKRRMDVICAKNRGGAVGSDQQVYFAEYDSITDGAEHRQ
jgi:replicative DNA helicase